MLNATNPHGANAMNKMHEANRRGWDAVSPHWQAKVDAAGEWRTCHIDPTLDEQELKYLDDISGKKTCVLGSGDNLIVFALAGMGADVTSVDISQTQLDIAAERAGELRLDIAFVRSDVTELEPLSDETFDLVYTGGHVAVWVSDLKTYYSEACRILKRGGVFMVNEYHPFRRLWAELPDRLEIEFEYFDKGPHVYDRSEDVPGAQEGSLPSYEFHWTVRDYVTAMIDAGCELIALDEMGDQPAKWEGAPLGGLPECLLMVGRKR